MMMVQGYGLAVWDEFAAQTRTVLHRGRELRRVFLVPVPTEATKAGTRTALLREHAG